MSHPQTKQKCIEKARQLVSRRPLFLDTETTGVHSTDEIIEICVVDFDGGILVDSLVRPKHPIPADSTKIHGITNAMVQDAPQWSEIWPSIEPIVAARVIGIFNADFDNRLIQQSHQISRIENGSQLSDTFCIMKLYAQFYGKRTNRQRSYQWQSLAKAAVQCQIGLPNLHRAKADTLLARAVLLHMANA